MIKFKNLHPELKDRISALEAAVFCKADAEKPKKKAAKKAASILLVGLIILGFGVAEARIVNRTVDPDAAISIRKIDVTVAPENSNYSNGNAYIQLPTTATGSLPAASSGNEGGFAYDDTTNTVKFSNALSWTEISASTSGAITATGAEISGATVNLNVNSNFAVNIGTGTTNAQVSIGGNSNAVAIDANSWDISSGGLAVFPNGRITDFASVSTGQTLTNAQSGKLIDNLTAGNTHDLPVGDTAGVWFTFTSGDANTFNIDPNGTDVIAWFDGTTTMAAGDKLLSPASATGSTVTLRCNGANTWMVVNLYASANSWSDNN